MTEPIAQLGPTSVPANHTTRATVEALFRHKTPFLITVFIVLAATALITIFTPRSYESEMSILVRNARPDYLITPERSNGQIVQQDVTEERINSEIESLRSKDVADAVVDPNWNAKPLSQRSEAEVKAHEKMILDFSKHLAVELVRKSNVIRVTYFTGSPREATDTVDRLLTAFLAKQHELALLPARLSKQERSVYNTQAVEQLTALLINYQNKRTELLTRYQPTDRLVLENAQQIKDTTAAHANARSNNGQETTTDVNPVYQQVKSTLTASTTDLVALRGRLTDLTGQRDRLRQQLSQVEGSTVDFNTLQACVTELQNNF